MNYTCRFSSITKNGNNLNSDAYIILTNIELLNKENLNILWENIIDIFEPNKNVVFVVSGFDMLDSDFPIYYLTIDDKKQELNIGNFMHNLGSNKFPIWRLEHCIYNLKLNDIIIPQVIELKEINSFAPIFQLEF